MRAMPGRAAQSQRLPDSDLRLLRTYQMIGSKARTAQAARDLRRGKPVSARQARKIAATAQVKADAAKVKRANPSLFKQARAAARKAERAAARGKKS